MHVDHPIPAALQHSLDDASCVTHRAARLAELAVAALIDEATLTPKPGLVDLRSRGAHRDLDWMLMCDSASALQPTFHAMAVAGALIKDLQMLREELGRIGRAGEAIMLRTTGGVNTHRGAIWALGLLIGAAAQAEDSAKNIAARAGAIARRCDRHVSQITGNKGEQACLTYGVGGARGQAIAGFPHVINIALPCLHDARERGFGEDHARLNALLSVIAELDDTCILSRGGIAALRAMQSGARAILDIGSMGQERESLLRQLEQQALTLGVSPGGAADLLAATLFLDSLTSTRTHAATLSR